MVLNKYRSSADKILTPTAKAFSGLSPNTLSAASVIFAMIACIAFIFADSSRFEDPFFAGRYIYVMLIIASVCIFLNGFLDAVDGKVARLTNQTSKRGDFLDHALDRYADVLILIGIMLSPFCNTVIGALAIVAVLLTSYMGTQAQALGCGRNYSGLLGRADRMAILIIAPLIQMWVVYYFPSGKIPVAYIENFTILEYVMLWFFIAGNITAVHRGIQSWVELREQEVPTSSERAKQFYESLSRSINKKERSQKIVRPVRRIRTKGQPNKKRIKKTSKYKDITSKKQLRPTRKQAVKRIRRTKKRASPKSKLEIEWE